ncbi:MAG: 30S ribosomal protein S19e [Candidatus Nanoarchaeia archaeon]|nr:30S ribosomal protein S19e [Candidatus Nanoarchaeia archaeon]
MSKFLEVNPEQLIKKVADELKKDERMSQPDWALFCKTGISREKVPDQDDWWYIRAASILRKVAMMGPVGVNKLSVKYGSKQNRGMKPEKFQRASRNILRTILQQLETKGFVKQAEIGVHKGRVVTKEGKDFLDQMSENL